MQRILAEVSLALNILASYKEQKRKPHVVLLCNFITVNKVAYKKSLINAHSQQFEYCVFDAWGICFFLFSCCYSGKHQQKQMIIENFATAWR